MASRALVSTSVDLLVPSVLTPTLQLASAIPERAHEATLTDDQLPRRQPPVQQRVEATARIVQLGYPSWTDFAQHLQASSARAQNRGARNFCRTCGGRARACPGG